MNFTEHSKDFKRDNSRVSQNSWQSGTNISFKSSFSAIKSNILRFKYKKDPPKVKNIRADSISKPNISITPKTFRKGAMTPAAKDPRSHFTQMSNYDSIKKQTINALLSRNTPVPGLATSRNKLANPLSGSNHI